MNVQAEPNFKIWTDEKDLPGDRPGTARRRAAREGQKVGEALTELQNRYRFGLDIAEPLKVSDKVPDVSVSVEQLGEAKRRSVFREIMKLQKQYGFRVAVSVTFRDH